MSKETKIERVPTRSTSATAEFLSPFENTKTGLIGEQRETMLQSQLQILPELGKCHRRGHKLPPLSFTYGIPNQRRDGGVAEALFHPAEKERIVHPDFELVRDYAALNKASLEAGITQSKGLTRFRSLHDLKKKVFIREVLPSKQQTLTFPDDHIFGRPPRPSTPIADVLHNSYSNQWIESMQQKQETLKKERTDVETVFRGNYQTKTSLLRQAKIPVLPKPLWKLPKFSHTENRVDSFRNEFERRHAFSMSDFDSISRQGSFHNGIYDVQRTTVKI